jgi:arylsulfatase A-like enzyme
MMWVGAGVPQGESDEPVYTVDFAPTLAGLAGIRVPEDLDGRRLF